MEDTTGTNPIILWSPTKPGETNNNATVYAKDGTLRNNSTSDIITSVYETYALHATTTINVDNSSVGARHDNKYTVYTQEKDNTQITVTTTIDSGDWRNNYYVKGFSVNGVTPALYEYNSDGTYSVTLTLGDKVHIMNDDKPVVRLYDDHAQAFGTPFDGGSGIALNESYPLKAIIFVERGEENSVHIPENKEIIQKLYFQTARMVNRETAEKMLVNLERLLHLTKFYVLTCNMDISAAYTAYNSIIEK